MNLEAVWHDLECGGYTDDLALWRGLAAETGGPVLDIGAGTGRVTLELAALDVPVVALDVASPLLAALACRAAGLPVETVVADALDFCLDRRFELIAVPMQTLQLFGGRTGRAAFLRCALEHLEPGGLLAAALADVVDCLDDEHDLPPPPETCEILGVRYVSQLRGVVNERGRTAIHRRREIVRAHNQPVGQDVVVHLDRVSAEEVDAQALELGFITQPHRYVPESERYLGSTVVVLKAPSTR
jgi:SAM-dependent methyltransferase